MARSRRSRRSDPATGLRALSANGSASGPDRFRPQTGFPLEAANIKRPMIESPGASLRRFARHGRFRIEPSTHSNKIFAEAGVQTLLIDDVEVSVWPSSVLLSGPPIGNSRCICRPARLAFAAAALTTQVPGLGELESAWERFAAYRHLPPCRIAGQQRQVRWRPPKHSVTTTTPVAFIATASALHKSLVLWLCDHDLRQYEDRIMPVCRPTNMFQLRNR